MRRSPTNTAGVLLPVVAFAYHGDWQPTPSAALCDTPDETRETASVKTAYAWLTIDRWIARLDSLSLGKGVAQY